MSSLRKSVQVLIIVIILLGFRISNPYSQMPFEHKERRLNVPIAPHGIGMTRGEVVEIDTEKIVILSGDGEKKEFYIISRTSFVKELDIDRSQLREGDVLLVLGQKDTEGKIYAEMLRVLSKNENTGERSPSGKPHFHSHEYAGRHQGFSEQGRDIRAPVRGMITKLTPLTIRLRSGETMIIESSHGMKIRKELYARASDIVIGMNVRIIVPPHGRGDREAVKVVLLDKESIQNDTQVPQMKSTGREHIDSIGDSHLPLSGMQTKEYIDSPFGFRDSPPQLSIYGDLGNHFTATGIRLAAWQDIEQRRGVYNFSGVDRNISRIIHNGQNIIIELRPINRLYGTSFIEDVKKKRSEYPEGHLKEYSEFVKAFVERYDGDGIADAPGSPVIKYYQCIHEILPKKTRLYNFWRISPDKYAEIFKLTYDAMNEACEDCTLYLSGAFLDDFDKDGFFSQVFKTFRKNNYRFRNIGFDYHFWSQKGTDYQTHKEYTDKITRLYKHFGYTDKEVEISALATGMPAALENERLQAVYLIKTYIFGLSIGLKKILWSHTLDKHNAVGQMFRYTGLIHDRENRGGYDHKKLSYYAYKLMLKKLRDCNWNTVETVLNGKDNVYAYKFQNKNKQRQIYVVWWEWLQEKNRSEKTLHLHIDSDRASVTSTIPEEKNGQSIVNMESTYHTQILIADPVTGKIQITLRDLPVYVEIENK